jgi:glutathione S-transferase
MIKLYQMEDCPFCSKVRRSLEELNIDYMAKPCLPGSPNREELLELGGKHQVPFMVDEEKGISMYESGDIVNYLNSNYGNN